MVRLILAVPLGLAVVALSGIGHRWFDILAQFTAPALLATVVLTTVIALTRLKVAALHGLVACVALVAAVAPQWFPGGPRAQTGAPIVRLYTANVYYLNDDVAAIRVAASRPSSIRITTSASAASIEARIAATASFR